MNFNQGSLTLFLVLGLVWHTISALIYPQHIVSLTTYSHTTQLCSCEWQCLKWHLFFQKLGIAQCKCSSKTCVFYKHQPSFLTLDTNSSFAIILIARSHCLYDSVTERRPRVWIMQHCSRIFLELCSWEWNRTPVWWALKDFPTAFTLGLLRRSNSWRIYLNRFASDRPVLCLFPPFSCF